LRNSIVHEGDIQVTMPYVPYREALSWIRGTHRTQVERGEALDIGVISANMAPRK